jgi:hypothetical protein
MNSLLSLFTFLSLSMTFLGLFVRANQAVENWAWANIPLLLLTGSTISLGTAAYLRINALDMEMQAATKTVKDAEVNTFRDRVVQIEQIQKQQNHRMNTAAAERKGLDDRMQELDDRMDTLEQYTMHD